MWEGLERAWPAEEAGSSVIQGEGRVESEVSMWGLVSESGPHKERVKSFKDIFFLDFFKFIYLFSRERERARAGEGQRERGRWNPKQALHHQHKARRGARTHRPVRS